MKKIIFIVTINLSLLFTSCFSDCGNIENVAGRYINRQDKDAIHYIEFKSDSTFIHYYKKGNNEQKHESTWITARCQIKAKEWKGFGSKKDDCAVLCYGIPLFIQGKYLNYTPDGNDLDSFVKE